MTEIPRTTRHLYVARHAEAAGEGEDAELTERGRRQAAALGRRLRGVPFAAVHHGPLTRAAHTARLVADQLDGVPLQVSEAAGDYVPHVPRREELPSDGADRLLALLSSVTEDERVRGAAHAKEALATFTGPAPGTRPRHELVVTHAFLVGWLLRDALDAPPWRWMGLPVGNTALTVIRYAPGRPPAVLSHNDTRHL